MKRTCIIVGLVLLTASQQAIAADFQCNTQFIRLCPDGKCSYVLDQQKWQIINGNILQIPYVRGETVSALLVDPTPIPNARWTKTAWKAEWPGMAKGTFELSIDTLKEFPSYFVYTQGNSETIGQCLTN